MITIEEEFLRWLCDTLGLLVVEELVDGGVQANDKACEELGRPEKYQLASVVNRLIGRRTDKAMLEEKIRRARSGVPEVFVDGQGRKALFVPLADKRVGTIITPRDLSQTSYSRLSALTPDVAAGMSHELANVVGAIAGWAKLAREGQRVGEALELIEKSSDKALSIARQMLGRARNDADDAPVDLSALAEEGARLLAPRASQAGVTIIRRISYGLMVRGTRDNVWSILWNPLINALEAMPHGGNLLIEVIRRGDRLRLAVEDSGSGMDEQTRARVFQPYFTTKKTGTGLGLALVKEAVDELGGTIELVSSRGMGTRVVIELPPAAESASRRPSVNKAVSPRRLSGRILVVDDDPVMREMMVTALAMYGAEVVNAASASEAIGVSGVFDVALVDVRLPDRSGEALLAELVASGKVRSGLLVSGSEAPDSAAFEAPAFRLLRKPFEIDDLLELVTSLIKEKQMPQACVAG